jgi:hypothetical protein
LAVGIPRDAGGLRKRRGDVVFGKSFVKHEPAVLAEKRRSGFVRR